MGGTASRASRRAFLGSALAALNLAAQSQKRAVLAPEWLRYEDPTTDLEVVRLTDPAHSSGLPAYYNRAVAHNSASLLYGADPTGPPQAFHLDLRDRRGAPVDRSRGTGRRFAGAFPDSRSFCCFAGRSLLHIAWATLRQREIYQIPEGWQRCPGMSLTPDGAHVLFAEQRGETSRLRAVSLARGISRTVIEARFAIEHPQACPGHDRICIGKPGKRSGWWIQMALTTAGSSWRRAHRLHALEPEREGHAIPEFPG